MITLMHAVQSGGKNAAKGINIKLTKLTYECYAQIIIKLKPRCVRCMKTIEKVSVRTRKTI